MKNLNHLIILLIFVSIINLKFIKSQSCDYNYECGNQFKECKKSLKLLIDGDKNAKIDIDRENRRVLFGARYLCEDESRILSISMDNGYDVISVASVFNNNAINGLVWVKPEDKNTLLFSNGSSNGSVFQMFKSDTNLFGNYVKLQDINRNYMFPSPTSNPKEFIDNSTLIESWVCSQVCHSQNKVNCIKQLGVDDVSLGVCDPIKIDKSDNTLYILVKEMNKIYIKTTDTFAFAIKMLPVFIEDSSINEMEVSTETKELFYSNKVLRKLYAVDLLNSSSIRVILDDAPTSFKFHDGFIYYSINGSKIEKISIIPGSNSTTLFDSNPNKGHCVCGVGFTGKNCECDTCNDKNIKITVSNLNLLGLIDLSTSTKCVPTVNRVPLTCNNNYQCNLDTKRYQTKTELFCKANSKGYNTCS